MSFLSILSGFSGEKFTGTSMTTATMRTEVVQQLAMLVLSLRVGAKKESAHKRKSLRVGLRRQRVQMAMETVVFNFFVLMAINIILAGLILYALVALADVLLEKSAKFLRVVEHEGDVFAVYSYGNFFSKKSLYHAKSGPHSFSKAVYLANGERASNSETEAVMAASKGANLVEKAIKAAEEAAKKVTLNG